MNENLSMLWAGAILDELARSGVAHVVASPGSRSAPLTLSAARDKRLRLHMVLDERSAGYFALGIAKTAQQPVAVLCTSGTAAANLLPAAVEAWQSRVPLILITADRPPELRDVGANQSIDQGGLFGKHVVWSCDLGVPELRAESLRHVRTMACRAAARASDGPVHVNVSLREPLEPSPDAAMAAFIQAHPLECVGRANNAPWTVIDSDERSPVSTQRLAKLAETLAEGHGVLMAGAVAGQDGTARGADELSRKLGAPLLADALSACRSCDAAIVHHDAFLASAAFRSAARPAWILQWGAAPTSKHVRAWLQQHADVPRIVLTEDGRLWEETQSAWQILRCDAGATLAALAGMVQPKPIGTWIARWRAAEAAARKVRDDDRSEAWEGAIGRRVAASALPSDILWLGSSLPVRDVDRYGGHLRGRAMSNRGASGIDGVLSSACGAASVHGGRVLLYVGDLSLLHDAAALGLVAKHRNLLLIVVNNGGGRIFEQLPAVDHLERALFERVMATPQDVDIAALCKAYRVPHVRLVGGKGIEDALAAGHAGVIEVVVDGPTAADYRTTMLRKAVEAVDRLD